MKKRVCKFHLGCQRCLIAGVANPRLASGMRLFAWFRAALTFVLKLAFLTYVHLSSIKYLGLRGKDKGNSPVLP